MDQSLIIASTMTERTDHAEGEPEEFEGGEVALELLFVSERCEEGIVLEPLLRRGGHGYSTSNRGAGGRESRTGRS